MGMLFLKILPGVLNLLLGVITWTKLNQALAAVVTSPASPRAARLKMTAALCFITGASLFLAATLLWSLDHGSRANEIVGWCGLAAFAGFLIIGVQCHRENKRAIAVQLRGDN